MAHAASSWGITHGRRRTAKQIADGSAPQVTTEDSGIRHRRRSNGFGMEPLKRSSAQSAAKQNVRLAIFTDCRASMHAG